MSVRLADRAFQYPVGIAENMLVKVGKFTFPIDFVILEMEEDSKVPLILGRPFLQTTDAVIRVKQKQLNLGVGTKRMIFHIDSTMKHSYSNDDTCFSIDVIDEILVEDFDALLDEDAHLVLNLEKCHFMVKEGNVLGYKVSEAGLKVDKAKIDTIVHTDHSSLRHLFKKQDAKPRLIRWILLLQEFDIEIKDRKGIENVAADHQSQIENEETCDDSEVDDNFPRETLMEINTKDDPWFADFANYLASDIIPKRMNFCFSDIKHYFWEEPCLFKECSDVAVDYVSKWAKAQALPTNDARVVITFLKKLFCRFRMPKALISDRRTHFRNKIMEKTMKRYGVNHRFSTSYHPQTSGQVVNVNRALKRILKKTVKDNPAIWSRKLDDALWAFHTSYKTITRTTSYKLIYGKNFHLPFEIEHRVYWALKNCNPYLIVVGEK
ncbi:reverse transcriptase domain-containing protein [Tanacetum coccineum]